MTDRKQTPDVLSAILGGGIADEITTPDPAAISPPEQPRKAGRKQTRRPASKSAKWEYLLVSFQEYKGWRPRYTNGQERADWMNAPVIHDCANQLGEEGWELISASAGQSVYGHTDRHQLYFKRPKR